jgi:hypothetical protein
MKPWREVAIPHSDVLKGTFQQAEFAADISAVRSGKAPDIYKDAALFFDRTYITEGMALLLTQVALRLAGQGGEPVVQLQTAFGGGKTHTLLAVLHLATRKCALSEMPGVASLIEKAGIMDVPKANVAVIDGTAHSPGQAWKEGRTTIKTLWGELAWQLGKSEGFDLVRENDANGTAPSKKVLQQLLEQYAPCVILMDELVAYVGQFEDGKALSGGTFESNTVFMQTLTEAAKQVPNCIVLASLPESELEVGTDRGKKALAALEKRFGRVQASGSPLPPRKPSRSFGAGSSSRSRTRRPALPSVALLPMPTLSTPALFPARRRRAATTTGLPRRTRSTPSSSSGSTTTGRRSRASSEPAAPSSSWRRSSTGSGRGTTPTSSSCLAAFRCSIPTCETR